MRYIFFSPFFVDDAGGIARKEMLEEMRDFTQYHIVKKFPLPYHEWDYSSTWTVGKEKALHFPILKKYGQPEEGAPLFCAVAMDYTRKPHPVLEQISDDDTLFVLGHGHSSFPIIGTSAEGGVELSAVDTALRLKISGLRQDFAGKIKLIVCEGGGGNMVSGCSFLDIFAETLGTTADPNELKGLDGKDKETYQNLHLGYTKCLIIGYTETLASFYQNFGGGQKHREVRMYKINSEGIREALPERRARARDYRKAFRAGKEVTLPTEISLGPVKWRV
jgi:hypothetical protein